MKRAPIYLSGMMGAGKTTVGKAVAAKLGVSFVDLDDRVARAAGTPTAGAALVELGEAAFRVLEAIEARRAIAEGAPVVALGGGTVTNRDVRWELLRRGVVVTLLTSVEACARRVGDGADRPLAGSDAKTTLERLFRERAPAYFECHFARPAGDEDDLDEVAEHVLLAAERRAVVVPRGLGTYRMEVGAGAREQLAYRDDAPRVRVLVTDENVDARWGLPLRALVDEPTAYVVLPPGEANKTSASVERIWDAAIAAGADRDSEILAVGGGVVGDVAGFAAATLFRGIDVVQVPTTLLAMVDSAIGGKTGVDRPEGKNLVGAFHHPRTVIADTDFLATLPPRERIAALAEVVKAAYVEGDAELAALERDAAALVAGDVDATTEAIHMAATCKAFVVARDPDETSTDAHRSRMVLNLGHTVGHALESASGYALRHGEAVSLGLVAALRVASRLGHAATCDAERVTALLAKLGLPTDLDARLDDAALARVAHDKKRRGGDVRFAVPVRPGGVEVRPVPLADLPRLLRL